MSTSTELSTPIRRKKVPTDPSQQFEGNPGENLGKNLTTEVKEINVPLPSGSYQGQSPSIFSIFSIENFKDSFDMTAMIYIFFIILFIGSGYYVRAIRATGVTHLIDSNGLPSVVSAVICAIAASVGFFILNFFQK